VRILELRAYWWNDIPTKNLEKRERIRLGFKGLWKHQCVKKSLGNETLVLRFLGQLREEIRGEVGGGEGAGPEGL